MKNYTAPALIAFGSVASLTADSDPNSAQMDSVYRVSGRGKGVGGSIDSCNFGQEENCLPSTGV
jgi:hypothetical protein